MVVPRRYLALEDRALLVLVGEGDGTALHALYERYGPPTYALARRAVGDDGLAGEVVRAVFLAVWQDGGRLGGAGGCAATLLSSAHRLAVETVRRAEHLHRRRAGEDTDAGAAGDDWSALRRGQVRTALDALPPTAREPLALAYFGGYTQQEVATLTGTTLAEVRGRMLGALRELRPLVGDATEPVR